MVPLGSASVSGACFTLPATFPLPLSTRVWSCLTRILSLESNSVAPFNSRQLALSSPGLPFYLQVPSGSLTNPLFSKSPPGAYPVPGPDRGSGDLEFKRCSPCPLCRGHGEPCQSKHKPGATGKSRAVMGIPAWGDFYQL